jgi:hypothetical protein
MSKDGVFKSTAHTPSECLPNIPLHLPHM